MPEPIGLPAPGRRVVTGVNPSGKSVIASDGFVHDDATCSEARIGSGGDLWIASHVPADPTDQSDLLVVGNEPFTLAGVLIDAAASEIL